jgi:pimeloyl-ACP methyl ester carboxylesterase
MVPGVIRHAGRRLRFTISDNAHAHGPDGPGSPPVWAVNIHGFFAGAQMYCRESAWLAHRLGWRIVNPSLPGFGGSDPLDWDHLSMPHLAEQVTALIDHLDTGPVVLLGHSMGGAVAVQFAHEHPGRTLGIVYRDGVAAPAWKRRHSFVTALLNPFLPDAAPFADMLAAMVFDIPDLFIGQMVNTVRSVLPDVRRNMRSIGHTLPLGSMLWTVDLRSELRGLVGQNMPILPMWGCFDRITGADAAEEFAELSRSEMVWVPGGHSWMLARPRGQADVLCHVPSGRRFLHEVEERWRRTVSADRSLRAVG